MMKHGFMIAGAVVIAGTLVAAQEAAQKPKPAPAQEAGQKPKPAPAQAPTTNLRARADIKGDGISGRAQLVEGQPGSGTVVQIQMLVTGLKPGKHGVHLHAVGKCTPDFTAAGGHFDPGPAGNTDPDANHPFHMGDLPNIEVGANGRGTMKAVTSRVTLSEGPLSLFDADGTAIIIHGNQDQMTTGETKSGVSGGPRVACGVIERQQ
jgi:Cu-Zn family superoxide dismutase